MSAPGPSGSLSRLPYELLAWTWEMMTYSDLTRLARTNKAVHQAVLPTLYRSVLVATKASRGTPADTTSFRYDYPTSVLCTTLESKPECWNYIRTIQFEVHLPDQADGHEVEARHNEDCYGDSRPVESRFPNQARPSPSEEFAYWIERAPRVTAVRVPATMRLLLPAGYFERLVHNAVRDGTYRFTRLSLPATFPAVGLSALLSSYPHLRHLELGSATEEEDEYPGRDYPPDWRNRNLPLASGGLVSLTASDLPPGLLARLLDVSSRVTSRNTLRSIEVPVWSLRELFAQQSLPNLETLTIWTLEISCHATENFLEEDPENEPEWTNFAASRRLSRLRFKGPDYAPPAFGAYFFASGGVLDRHLPPAIRHLEFLGEFFPYGAIEEVLPKMQQLATLTISHEVLPYGYPTDDYPERTSEEWFGLSTSYAVVRICIELDIELEWPADDTKADPLVWDLRIRDGSSLASRLAKPRIRSLDRFRAW